MLNHYVEVAFFYVPECPAGTFGANCQLSCECHNNGSCDRVTGMCHCGPGYYGHLCERGEDGTVNTHRQTGVCYWIIPSLSCYHKSQILY